jgi:integrase
VPARETVGSEIPAPCDVLAGDRPAATVIIDQGTADVQKALRSLQRSERLSWGPAWTDTGRVFTREDGTLVRPGWVSERFGTLAPRAGLPPVRFHDLRHGAASMQLAAGTPMKVVSEMLSHATMSFTATSTPA